MGVLALILAAVGGYFLRPGHGVATTTVVVEDEKGQRIERQIPLREYRKRLVERIGLQAVESIESDNTLRKYSHEGLIELAKHYRAAALATKKGNP